MKHNDFASFYVIDYSSWFQYNYYNKINCNNSLHWLQVVVYNIGQTQAVKILLNVSTIFIKPPGPSMEFTHWNSNDWNPITETRFQADTLESLSDWLALSDSIFYWPGRNLASISWKTHLNQVTYLETQTILKFRYFCENSVKIPLSICAYP